MTGKLTTRSPARWTCHAAGRAIAAAALAAALAGATLAVGAGPAAAHAHLTGMTPAAGSTVTAAPATVVLTFDEAVQSSFAVVAVTAADGSRLDSGTPTVVEGTVTQVLRPLPGSGRYTVAFRVVSDDGHPVSAQEQFRFAAPAGYQPPAASPTSAGAAVTAPTSRMVAPAERATAPRGGGSGRLVGEIVVVVVVAALLLLRQRRRRT